MSQLDKLAGRMGWTLWVPEDRGDFILGGFGHHPNNNDAGGGGIGCLGIAAMVISPVMVLIGPLFLLPMWPVRGAIGCLAMALAMVIEYATMPTAPSASDPMHTLSIFNIFVNTPAGIFGLAVFLGTARFERRAEAHRAYRIFRTFTRVMFAPIFVDTLVVPVLLLFVSWQAAFDWGVLSGVTGPKVLRIIAEMGAFYLFLCWRATRDRKRELAQTADAAELARLSASLAEPRPARPRQRSGNGR